MFMEIAAERIVVPTQVLNSMIKLERLQFRSLCYLLQTACQMFTGSVSVQFNKLSVSCQRIHDTSSCETDVVIGKSAKDSRSQTTDGHRLQIGFQKCENNAITGNCGNDRKWIEQYQRLFLYSNTVGNLLYEVPTIFFGRGSFVKICGLHYFLAFTRSKVLITSISLLKKLNLSIVHPCSHRW